MTRKSIELFDFDDTRAVSPVIGVILMVAITVILAAVIGTFVLGLGENVSNTTPQAQLSMSVTGQNITIDHNGGDAIAADTIKIKVQNDSKSSTWDFTNTTELGVGDSALINMDNGNVYWPDDGTGNVTGNSAPGFTLSSGSYTVKIIDTESQQLIASQKVRP